MHLFPSPETAGTYGTSSTLLATAIIEDIAGLCAKYRQAAADHRCRRNIESARVLEEAADTCEDIVEMIRNEYVTVRSNDRPGRPVGDACAGPRRRRCRRQVLRLVAQ